MAAPPQTNSGFVSLADYLGANQGATDATAQNLAASDTTAAQNAENEDNNVGTEATAQRASHYTGHSTDPTTLADYADAQSDTDQAATKLAGLSDSGGISSQLQGTVGAKDGQYTQDDANFDTSLIQGSGSARNTLGQAQGQYSNLSDYLANATAAPAAAPAAPAPKMAPSSQTGGPTPVQPGETPGNAKNDPEGEENKRPEEGGM